jgi:hypothetical protein
MTILARHKARVSKRSREERQKEEREEEGRRREEERERMGGKVEGLATTSKLQKHTKDTRPQPLRSMSDLSGTKSRAEKAA